MHPSVLAFAVAVLALPGALLVQPMPAGSNGFVHIATSGPAPDHVMTNAPVPSIPPAGTPPEDRAAQPGSDALAAGPINSTPFSSTPDSTTSEGGTAGSETDRVLAPKDTTGVVPNLGK